MITEFRNTEHLFMKKRIALAGSWLQHMDSLVQPHSNRYSAFLCSESCAFDWMKPIGCTHIFPQSHSKLNGFFHEALIIRVCRPSDVWWLSNKWSRLHRIPLLIHMPLCPDEMSSSPIIRWSWLFLADTKCLKSDSVAISSSWLVWLPTVRTGFIHSFIFSLLLFYPSFLCRLVLLLFYFLVQGTFQPFKSASTSKMARFSFVRASVATLFATVGLFGLPGQAVPVKRQTASITTLSSADIASFTPFSFYAAMAYCQPSQILAKSCGRTSIFSSISMESS